MQKRKKISDNLRVEELPPVSGYLSTGCTILDLGIAGRLPGGFGMGRISHIWGPESTSKSIISLEPLGSAQRQGGVAHHVDSEGTLDFGRANDLFGVNTDDLNYISAFTDKNMPDNLTVEYLFNDIIEPILDKCDGSAPNVIAVDSLSAITSEKEVADNDAYGAAKAKQMSALFRKNIWKFTKKNLAIIFVDQARQNLGVTFGEKLTYSGGKALDFYASTRVKLVKVGTIQNENKRDIGVRIKFKVDKNKIAPPFREGVFNVLFDYGIDNITTNLEWLYDNTEVGASKGWLNLWGEKFRLKGAVEMIEDENLEDELDQLVYKYWKEIYKPADRKRRER